MALKVGIPPPLLGVRIVNAPDAMPVFRFQNELGNRRYHYEEENPPIVQGEHNRRRADAYHALKVVELLLQQDDHREDTLTFRLGEEILELGTFVGGDVDVALAFNQLQLEVLVHHEMQFTIEEAFPGVQRIGNNGGADRQDGQPGHAAGQLVAGGANQLIDQQGENARLQKRKAGDQKRQESLDDDDAWLLLPGRRQQSAGVHQHTPDSRERRSHEFLPSRALWRGNVV